MQNTGFAYLALCLKMFNKNSTKSFNYIAKLRFCKSSFMHEKCLTKNFKISLLEDMIENSYSFFSCKKSVIEQRDKGGDNFEWISYSR